MIAMKIIERLSLKWRYAIARAQLTSLLLTVTNVTHCSGITLIIKWSGKLGK